MIAKLRERSESLAFRIAALLALALLPIGVISVAITIQLFQQADRRAETNLLARTAEAADPEEEMIRTAMGAAELLAAMTGDLRDTDANCEAPLRSFVENIGTLSFAGYIDVSGDIACASRGQGGNVAGHPVFAAMAFEPRSRVTLTRDLVGMKWLEIVVTVPVFEDNRFDGFVAVSLPHGSLFRAASSNEPVGRQVDLFTFNSEAEILTSTIGLENAAARLPQNVQLESLTNNVRTAFIDRTRQGNLRVFAVVPIVPGQVYALGSWPHRRDDLVAGLSATGLMVVPVVMWLVCLLVAFYAVQRMVIRPTRNLRARMLQFMRSRRLAEPEDNIVTPRELRDMEDTWMRLAENVLHDEAKLYDTIHQRTVLLKEVHHRVKNNLQLIVSILNMKVRKANDAAIRAAMTDIRQRVMGIARVHQNLYETSTTERVQASELLPLITEQIIQTGLDNPDSVEVRQSYDEMVIYPDQAIPLSLAATELLTNALKYIGAPRGERPVLEIRLVRAAERNARLTVCNSLPDQASAPEVTATSGLGLALVKAFAQQLDGVCSVSCVDGSYCATIQFPIADFEEAEPQESLRAVS